MAIDPELLEKIQAKLRVGRTRAYELIKQRSQQLVISRELAAMAIAHEAGINISRHASDEDLATIRQAIAAASGTTVPAPPPPTTDRSQPRSARKRSTSAKKTTHKRSGRRIFVVHGRNEALRRAMFDFLRAIGLQPVEWQHALKATGTASPYIGEVLDKAFEDATAVVVLLSPDDEAQLREEFRKRTDPDYESRLTPQARPNVLFEAGMAFGHDAKSTVLVQVGELRPFSDVVGRHVVHLTNAPESRIELANKLETAGCDVDRTGHDWLRSGDFESDV